MKKPTKKEIKEWELELAKELPKFYDGVFKETGLLTALGLAHMYVKNNGSPLGKEIDPMNAALFRFIRNSV